MVGIIQLSHKMREAQAGNYAYCDFFFFPVLGWGGWGWGGRGIYFSCSNPRSLYREISIVFMELEFIAAKMDSTHVFAWVGGVGGGFYFFCSNARSSLFKEISIVFNGIYNSKDGLNSSVCMGGWWVLFLFIMEYWKGFLFFFLFYFFGV